MPISRGVRRDSVEASASLPVAPGAPAISRGVRRDSVEAPEMAVGEQHGHRLFLAVYAATPLKPSSL